MCNHKLQQMLVRKSKGFDRQGIEKSYLNVGKGSNKHFVGGEIIRDPKGEMEEQGSSLLGTEGETVM